MENFVPFEIAKKLKEKGFDIPCTYAYCKKGGGWNMYAQKHEPITYILRTDGNPFGTYYTGKNWNKEYKTNKHKIQCSAPTISQVLKWLREEKKIYVSITYSPKIENFQDFYYATIQYIGDYQKTSYTNGNDNYDNWEGAALNGIEYVLNNLI